KFQDSKGVTPDTRKDLKDTLFFCLQGENFDGKTFVPLALEKGAKWVVTSEPPGASEPKAIVVKDTLWALQELATYH
ncbi:Mur ligase domain-containing protein, partial [Capnocytophaga gingivalis]